MASFEKDVRLSFYLPESAPDQTEVTFWFSELLRKPHFLIAYIGGIINWVDRMHDKDLVALKKYVEAI